jgi:RNA polymerase sigma-70 factor (ECF subfamily)
VSRFQPADAGEAPDLAALSEVLHGNPEAFRLIVERYKKLLYRLSYSFLGNHEDAEESTQDILMRAFRYLPRFSLEKRFLPWLYGIAVNQLRTSYARNRRRESSRLAWESTPDGAPAEDPQEMLETAQSRVGVRAAVASLPRILREPVILHYFEELSVAAIAEVLGIGEVNVKSRLLRGRRQLKRMLDGHATPPC